VRRQALSPGHLERGEKIGAGSVDGIVREVKKSLDGWELELTLVEEQKTEPKMDGQNTFSAGTVAGRSFLWSFAESKVICAGAFVAMSSKSVQVTTSRAMPTEQVTVEADLRREAMRDAVLRMRAVGERQP